VTARRDLLAEFEISTSLAEAIRSAVGTGVAEAVKEAGAGHVTEILLDVASEGARGIAESLAGPLLKILLRAADRTSQKLDQLLREPLETGIRSARDALEIVPQSEEGRRFREAQLNFAYTKLESAYTLATGPKAVDARFYVKLLQGFIARAMGATEYSRRDFVACLHALEKERTELRTLRERAKTLTELLTGIDRQQFLRSWGDYVRANDRMMIGKTRSRLTDPPLITWINESDAVDHRIGELAPALGLLESLSSS
jgi:hypothetical protein